ncbi:hypothetical protein BGZ49_010285 [Haplosporangium sp. Z 27]|nr:hypothetical protein BGZ49_010285 [Haplosporangium sp. Z 27]
MRYMLVPGYDRHVPENLERLNNPRPISGSRLSDIRHEIAKYINQRHPDAYLNSTEIRGKINYLRVKYEKAKGLETEAGDKSTCRERILKICPYYDRLHDVFKDTPPASTAAQEIGSHSSQTFSKEESIPISISSPGSSSNEDEDEDDTGKRSTDDMDPQIEGEESGEDPAKKRKRVDILESPNEFQVQLENNEPRSDISNSGSTQQQNQSAELKEQWNILRRREKAIEMEAKMLDKRAQDLEASYNRRMQELVKEKEDFRQDKAEFRQEKAEFKQEVSAFKKERDNLIRENADIILRTLGRK